MRVSTRHLGAGTLEVTDLEGTYRLNCDETRAALRDGWYIGGLKKDHVDWQARKEEAIEWQRQLLQGLTDLEGERRKEQRRLTHGKLVAGVDFDVHQT